MLTAAQVFLKLSSPSPARCYDSQHSTAATAVTWVSLPSGLVVPLGYSSLSPPLFLFLNHSIFPTIYKITALWNHFNKLAVIHCTKRFKYLPWDGDATMTASQHAWSKAKMRPDSRGQSRSKVPGSQTEEPGCRQSLGAGRQQKTHEMLRHPQRTGRGCWVMSTLKRFLMVIRCREYLSSGENRAGWAEHVCCPIGSSFCSRRKERT